MGEFGLGPEVKRIIASDLATMDHVEVLLLLHKAAPTSRRVDDMIPANAVWLYTIVAFLLVVAANLEKTGSGPSLDRGSTRLG